jgi:hypothetical protein
MLLGAPLSACGAQSDADRLAADLVAKMPNAVRAKCAKPTATHLTWSYRCGIESDPGSGWWGPVYVWVEDTGCWRTHFRHPPRTISDCDRDLAQ